MNNMNKRAPRADASTKPATDDNGGGDGGDGDDDEDDNGGGDGGDGDSHLAIRREALVAVDGLGVAELDILVFVPICKSC